MRQPEDASPMIDAKRNLALTPADEVALIPGTFEKRSADPTVPDPSAAENGPENALPRPFRQIKMGQCDPIRMPEVLMAIAQLTEGKAPGPDGRPVELYTRLHSRRPYPLMLLNGLYRTGNIPTNLRAFYVAPAAKPGKIPKM